MSINKFYRRAGKIKSYLCVGLDSDMAKIPSQFKSKKFPQHSFNRHIIKQTHKFASAFKINSAFYEARGCEGTRELKMTVDYLRKKHPDIYLICDAKRGDIGNTNNGYVSAIFDYFSFDAITVNPYLGREALAPFLARKDKDIFILCRTSNPGAGELQDLKIKKRPLWQLVLKKITTSWNENKNCQAVIGATGIQELKLARSIAPQTTFLVPGVGAQGGDVKEIINAGAGRKNLSLIINSSRGIIFSRNPAMEAKKVRDEINKYCPDYR